MFLLWDNAASPTHSS